MAENKSRLRTARDRGNPFEGLSTSPRIDRDQLYEDLRGDEGELAKSLRRGAAGLTATSLADDALDAEAAGDPNYQELRDRSLRVLASQQRYAPRVSSLRDIRGVGDAVDYATGMIGQGVMSMAPTIGAALLTRGRVLPFAAAAATGYQLERGEAALNQYADPVLSQADVETRDRAARAKGLVGAGLEAIVPASLSRSILRGPSTGLGRRVRDNALTEGVTETAQQYTGHLAEKYIDPNRELDGWELADAFAGGALTGGAVTLGTAPFTNVTEVPTADTPPPIAEADPNAPSLPPPQPPSRGIPLGDDPEGFVSSVTRRMSEAAKQAATAGEYLRSVFGNVADDFVDLVRRGDNDPTLGGATPDETIARLTQRDAERARMATEVVGELLASETLPDAVKAELAALDPTNEGDQQRIADIVEAGQENDRIVTAIDALIESAERLKPKPPKGGTRKNNLMSTTDTEQAVFDRLIWDGLTEQARANPAVRENLSELANSLLAYAARTGEMTQDDLKNLTRLREGLSIFTDPEATAQQLLEYAGVPRLDDSFLSRIQRIPSAQQDVRNPNSFLYMSLTDEAKNALTPRQLSQLARLVDEFSLLDRPASEPGKANKADTLLQGLAQAFGSEDAARTVLSYYQRQVKADLRHEPDQTLTVPDDTEGMDFETQVNSGINERDAPEASFQFADPKTMRPYRRFAGSPGEYSPGMRGRLRESTRAAAAIRSSRPDADVRPVPLSEYIAQTGGDPEAEVRRLAADIKRRIDGHKKRKGEDRTEQINVLEGELALMRHAYKEGGAQAALDLYEVLQVGNREQTDGMASDEDLNRFSKLAEVKSARDTRVTFRRKDGSKFTLSAESMWKTQGDKEGSGGGERADYRARRLFADAVASVLARPEVEALETPLENVIIDRKLGKKGLRAKPKSSPAYRKAVYDTLQAASGSLNELRARLKDAVDEYIELGDPDPSGENESRRAEIEDVIEQNILQLNSRLEQAKKGEGPLAGNRPAQRVAYARRDLYEQAKSDIDAIKYEEAFDAREATANTDEMDDTQTGPIQRGGRGYAFSTANRIEEGSDRYTEGTHASDIRQQVQQQNEAVHQVKTVSGKVVNVTNPTASAMRERITTATPERREEAEALLARREALEAKAAPNTRKQSTDKNVAQRERMLGRGTDANQHERYADLLRQRYAQRGQYSDPDKQGIEPTSELLAHSYEGLLALRANAKAQIARIKQADKNKTAVGKSWSPKTRFGKSTKELETFIAAIERALQLKGFVDPIEQTAESTTGSTRKQSTMNPRRGRPPNIDRAAILREIRRMRGEDVKVIFRHFAEIGVSGEFSMNADRTERLIKIAINAANPAGVAYHESLHDFFATLGNSREERRLKKDLLDAANAPQVRKRLNELLKDHPDALKQIERDPEERLAYMFQFWAEGHLTLGPRGTNIFQRLVAMIRDLLGVVSSDQRARDAFAALYEGRFADMSTAGEVLATLRPTLGGKVEALAPWLAKASEKLLTAGPDQLRGFQNESLNKIADMFAPERGMGFIQRRMQQQGQWENKLAKVFEGTTADERRKALHNMQAMRAPSSPLERRLARFFREMHVYLTDAGVKRFNPDTKEWEDLGKVERFFPRVWDPQRIMANLDEWRTLLSQYIKDPAQIDAVTNKILSGDGQLDLSEDQKHLGFTPFEAAALRRTLDFINESNAEQFVKFQKQDVFDVTMNYVKQAVHRAEYSRQFGNAGEVLQELIEQSGIKDQRELAEIGAIIQGMEGTLGNDTSPAMKSMMAWAMTAQNVILLPLAVFSQAIDPIMIAARTGEMGDAVRAYGTALNRLKDFITKNKDKDHAEQVAEMLGIISSDSTLEAMGMSYSTAYMPEAARKLNREFFKWNGMQGWNNSMRIAATAAGEVHLLRNAKDEALLDELGLQDGDVVNYKGRLAITPEQFAAARGGKVSAADRARAQRIQRAMFQFVDSAVLRPSAAHRPTWMSDPKFLLIGHLKQFTFSMHNVVLKRATRELDRGNPRPMLILMSAIPVILAADTAKFILTGTTPETWSIWDHLMHAVNRSGILGLGEFGSQILGDLQRGKLPGESMIGPTGEHLLTILRWLAGDVRTDFVDVLERTVPGARFI